MEYMRNGKKTSTRKSTKSAKLSHKTGNSVSQLKINNFLNLIQPLGEPRGQGGLDASKPGPSLYIGVQGQAEVTADTSTEQNKVPTKNLNSEEDQDQRGKGTRTRATQ